MWHPGPGSASHLGLWSSVGVPCYIPGRRLHTVCRTWRLAEPNCAPYLPTVATGLHSATDSEEPYWSSRRWSHSEVWRPSSTRLTAYVPETSHQYRTWRGWAEWILRDQDRSPTYWTAVYFLLHPDTLGRQRTWDYDTLYQRGWSNFASCRYLHQQTMHRGPYGEQTGHGPEVWHSVPQPPLDTVPPHRDGRFRAGHWDQCPASAHPDQWGQFQEWRGQSVLRPDP